MHGLRPVAEIQFADYIHPAYDQIVNEAAKIRYRSNGAFSCPLVFRAPFGAGVHGGLYHSQSVEALFFHVPGLKIVVPSTPYDCKGLLKAAIRDDDPVLFFEHKKSYRRMRGEVPDGDVTIPLGKADLKRAGSDLSIVTYGIGVHLALAAGERLAAEGIEVEILDLRTLAPLDRDAIARSVANTSKVLILHEDNKTGGIGAEMAAMIAEEYFEELDGPIMRVAAADTHIPYAPSLEEAIMPNVEDVVTALAARGLLNDRGAHGNDSLDASAGGIGRRGHDRQAAERPGDRVERDEPLVEMMTDKVNAEIPSPVAGVIEQVVVQEGDVVPVGGAIYVIGDGSGQAASVTGDRRDRGGGSRCSSCRCCQAAAAGAPPAAPPPPTGPARTGARRRGRGAGSRPRRRSAPTAPRSGPHRSCARWPASTGSIWPRSAAAASAGESPRTTSWRTLSRRARSRSLLLRQLAPAPVAASAPAAPPAPVAPAAPAAPSAPAAPAAPAAALGTHRPGRGAGPAHPDAPRHRRAHGQEPPDLAARLGHDRDRCDAAGQAPRRPAWMPGRRARASS